MLEQIFTRDAIKNIKQFHSIRGIENKYNYETIIGNNRPSEQKIRQFNRCQGKMTVNIITVNTNPTRRSDKEPAT